ATNQDGLRGQSFSLVLEHRASRKRANLGVQVVDVNDSPPVFINLPSEVYISE
ncbi:CRE-CDH-8 protein, partial [Aphelenchoides avenae]